MLNGRQLHFIGIGGIGMSGLARICHERGHAVAGCDVSDGHALRTLRQHGISIAIGHHPHHLTPEVGLVVYSSAVSPHEAELCGARALGIRTVSRGELLAELASSARLVAVAGAHGKTTTAGMASQLLVQAGWDPTVVVGGHVRSLGGNARSGHGRYLVAETDESDGSFLLLKPLLAIVTNIDREHLNHYQTFDNLVAAFRQFVGQLEPEGVLIRCEDDPVIRDVLSSSHQITYGMSPQADVTAGAITPCGWGSAFTARYGGQRLGTFSLRVPGRHNVLNALAVISLGIALDIPLSLIREALWTFRGTSRRFELFQLPNDVWFIEDYAHHPAEIRATLAADPFTGRHRVVVFQPHRFSRTKLLEQEFTTCFEQADGIVVTDVYAAFEAPIPGVSGERMATLIKARGHPCVRYVPRTELPDYLTHIIQPHDTVFFLGAGDIGELCHELVAQLRSTNGIAG